MTDKKLYEYYEKQAILPTFANFRSLADLEAYEVGRRTLFADRLAVPLRLFRGARLLEFGPDSGENALVFARWGARLTLVEPNPHALDPLCRYFEAFDLTGSLDAVIQADVEGFETDQRYDIIIAEGFIYTIQPQTRWLDVLAARLAPQGIAVVSYYERRGAFFELALRATLAAAMGVSGRSVEDTARALFSAKWDSIPHTRAFESWVMDVLRNPFVRLSTCLDAGGLMADALARNLTVHAAWPSYSDSLRVHWHKRPVPDTERLARDREHIDRACLSFVAGAKLYLTGPAEAVRAVAAEVDRALEAVDAVIDGADPAALARLDQALGTLIATAAGAQVLAEAPGDLDRLVAALSAQRRLFAAAAAGRFDDMVSVCATDPAFIETWGQPAHLLALRARG